VPLIAARRAGTCTACGGAVRKHEQAWFTTEQGLRHPACATSTSTVHRTNQRAGTCACGAHVPASTGRLVHLGSVVRNGQHVQQWAVRCGSCSSA
jgi:hypothetical protein